MVEKKKKKPYVRPCSACMVVGLESPICTGSDFQVQSPHGDSGIDAQPVDTEFGGVNDFSDTGWS